MASEPEVLDGEVLPDTPAPEANEPEARQQAHEIVRYSGGSTELIRGENASDRVAVARDIATALNDVIVSQGLRTKVGSMKVVQADGTEVWKDRFHINVEAWQTLATLLGVAIIPRPPVAAVDPSTGRPILRNFEVREKSYYKKNEGGGLKSERSWTVEGHDWQVTVDVVKDGALIASGTGLCSRTETKWNSSEEYALQSMAATRATGRAMKAAAAWIVALAGYNTTPAEEMPPQAPEGDTEHPFGAPVAAASVARVKAALAILAGDEEKGAVLAAQIEKDAGYFPRISGRALMFAAGAVKANQTPAEPAA